MQDSGTGNDMLWIQIWPAWSETGEGYGRTATGSIVIDYPCVFLNQSYASSPIETGDSPVSQASQASDSSGNGLSIALADLSPRVTAALGSQGTMLFKWRPDFDYDDIPAGTYGLIGFNDEAGSGLYIDGSGNIIAGDGTNTVTHSVQWSKGDMIYIMLTWTGSTMTVHSRIDNGAWSNTSGSFDGQMPYNDTLRPFFDFEFPAFGDKLLAYDAVLTTSDADREFLR
jgi:hypothetical protein